MYDSGYGADMRADLYGQAATDEEERRRRERERQQAQPTMGAAPPPQAPTQPQQQPGLPQNQQAQQQFAQAQQPQRDARTFAQRQQAGEARPAPPQAPAPMQAPQMMPPQGQMQQMQQMQPLGMGLSPVSRFASAPTSPMSQQAAQQAQALGLDPIAAAMNPSGFQQQLADMGGMAESLPPEFAMSPVRQANGGGVNPDNIQPVGDGGFTGDIGSYLEGMLSGVTTGTVPDTYRPPNRIMDRAQQLTNAELVSAPEVSQDLELMNQVRAMNGLPPLPSTRGAAGGAPAGVSSAGVNPAAALGGTPATGVEYGNAAIAANEIAAMQRREANGGIDPAAEAARASLGLPPSTAAGASASGPNIFTGGTTGTGAAPAGGGSVNSLTEQSIKDALQNPSAFDNEQVRNLYNRLGQDIDDQFRQQEVAMREEMAGRGLSDSSIMGGRLADLNVGRRTASAELANRLGIQRAQDFANARAQAIGMGQQQRQNVFGEEMGRANVGLQQSQLSQAAARDAFNQKMQGMQFQNQLGQQQFGNQMDRARLQAALSGQGFEQGLQGLTFQNALGQQGFANDMARAGLQRDLRNDAFTQRMGLSDRLTNYGQQAFNNDMATQQFNAQQDNAYRNFMLQMLGLGG